MAPACPLRSTSKDGGEEGGSMKLNTIFSPSQSEAQPFCVSHLLRAFKIAFLSELAGVVTGGMLPSSSPGSPLRWNLRRRSDGASLRLTLARVALFLLWVRPCRSSCSVFHTAQSSTTPTHYNERNLFIFVLAFAGMLGELFPAAQFVVTGVLGPSSNAHGPNEFLHIGFTKRIIGAVAFLLAEHAKRSV